MRELFVFGPTFLLQNTIGGLLFNSETTLAHEKNHLEK